MNRDLIMLKLVGYMSILLIVFQLVTQELNMRDNGKPLKRIVSHSMSENYLHSQLALASCKAVMRPCPAVSLPPRNLEFKRSCDMHV